MHKVEIKAELLPNPTLKPYIGKACINWTVELNGTVILREKDYKNWLNPIAKMKKYKDFENCPSNIRHMATRLEHALEKGYTPESPNTIPMQYTPECASWD